MGRKKNIAVKNDELLEGVIVMAAISADGRYLPFHPLENNPNLAAKIAAVENMPTRIHTVVIAKGQVQQEPEEGSYRLIEAENFKDLIKQLEDNGGVFGEELRQQAREEREALWLPGRPDPDIDWNSLYQVPRLRLIDMAKAARPSGPRSPDGRDRSDDEVIRSSIDGYEEVLGADKLPLDRELLANEFLNGLLSSSTHQRGIILGPPGSGKSSFMGWLVRNMADTIPDNGSLRPFPILVRLAVWEAAWKDAGKKLPLEKWLAELTGEWSATKKKKRKTFLKNWLAQGRIVPLFDGLDEIGKYFFGYFTKIIRQLVKDHQRFVISCRTVSEERYRALSLPLYYLASLDQTARDAYIANFPWENEDRRETVQAHLPNAHAIAALTTNPQLLSFLCHTADRNTTMSLPLVRVELIGAMLRTLLEEKPVNIPEENLLTQKYTPVRMTRWLATIAFRLFTSDAKRRMIFPAEELEKMVEEVVGQTNEDMVQPFIEEMRQRGVLRPHPQGWFFFHLILQEYLTAHELAWRIEESGFEAEQTFVGETKPLGEWLYDWSLEPHWEEVMLLTAGLLEKPADYLTHVAKPARDTLFRHRLSLAARMTGELPQHQYKQNTLKNAARNILNTVRDIWISLGYESSQPLVLDLTFRSNLTGMWKYITQDIWVGLDNDPVQRPIIDQMNKAALMLWHRPDNDMITDQIFKSALSSKEKLRNNQTVLLLTEHGLKPIWGEIILELVERLNDEAWEVSSRAAEALGLLGSTVAQDEIISELLRMLNTPDNGVIRSSAATALGSIGVFVSDQSQEGIVDALLERLLDDNAIFVREASINSLVTLAQQASLQKYLITFLLEKLDDPDKNICISAAQAIGAFGTMPDQENLDTALLKKLNDKDSFVRGLAAIALGIHRPTSIQHDIIVALLLWLDGGNGSERMHISAAMALYELGPTSAQKGVIKALLKRLNDESFLVRAAVVQAIGSLGAEAAQKKVISALRHRVETDRWQQVRFLAANALEELGQQQEKKDGYSAVLQRVGNGGSLEKWATISHAELKSEIIPIEMLNTLLQRADKQWLFHGWIAEGFGTVFSPWKESKDLNSAIEQRMDDEWFVLEWVTKTLVSLEAHSIDSDQIKSVIKLCRSARSSKNHIYLIRGLSKFGLAANRPPITTGLENFMSIRYGLRVWLTAFIALRKIRS